MITNSFAIHASLDVDKRLAIQYRQIGLAAIAFIASHLLPLNSMHIPVVGYAAIHTLLESLAVLTSFLAFATVWSTPSRTQSASMVLIALGLLAAGILDFLHMQSIVGMPDLITPSSAQKGIAFWFGARFAAAVGMLAASLMPSATTSSSRTRRMLVTGTALYVLLVSYLVLFEEGSVPLFFIVGEGTTPLKSACEGVLALMFGITAWQYWKRAKKSDESYHSLMFGALGIAAIGELFFLGYTVPNDAQNLMGHAYKILVYWLIFQAMFVLGVRKPYARLAVETASLKHANETLRVQALVLECTATPIVITDVQGLVVWRNPVSLEFSKLFPPGPYRMFDERMTPDAQQREEVRSTLEMGKPWRGHVVMRSIHGLDIHLNRTITPLRNEDGSLEGYVVVSENITDSVMAESRHKRVLDSALDGFWVVDRQGKFLEVNESYARMTGYSKEELMAMHVADVEAAQSPEEVQDIISRVIKDGSAQFKTQHRCKNGSAISVEISVKFDSEANHFYVFVRDRTEQERTSAIQLDMERQLHQSQKMQALGQLTGGIAHDFNNILASILGYANLALTRYAKDADPKLGKYLQEISGAGERARDLIAKMLTFSRTQPSKPAGPISPAAVIHEVVSMLHPSLPSSIKFTSRVETDKTIHMDAGELNQMLVNLVINARDAITGQGRIDLCLREVTLHERASAITGERLSGTFISIEVSDNGSGIPVEIQGSLFNPFFTTKDVGKGTGLGLSMVQGILQKCGGHITLESELGKGSHFQLLFPTEALEPPSTPPDSATPATSQHGAGQVVWVVDDERAVGDYVGELLEDAGYTVQVFSDPLNALSAFKTHRSKVDLLITDQTMPGLTGTQLAGMLRSVSKDLPVIVCTGFSDGVPAHEMQGQTLQKLLIKPVPAETLLQSIAQILYPSNEVQHV